ncbi:MAG: GWxTD domain-containing protein, partial [Candidatus Aminicenantales bacterium]
VVLSAISGLSPLNVSLKVLDGRVGELVRFYLFSYNENMRRIAFLIAALSSLCLIGSAVGQKKLKESDLSPKYQEWLNLVAYIILPQEKDVFLRLASDFDRDIFIESFWKQRDPTPGTLENEYKDEVLKRFAYVNKEFSRDTPRPGWMTDRGRIYMILGAPQYRESITLPELQPCELWTYYGDVSKGLPNYFGLVFFRRGGSGEYKLYSPALDGPKSLIIKTPSLEVDLDNPLEVYQMLAERAPTIAPYVYSIVPQEGFYAAEPSTFTEAYMASIYESPYKNINPSYATHFLNYKGLVSTEYLTNFVDSDATVAILCDPVLGIPFLHYSIAPKTITMDYYEPKDQYFCNFAVDVSLKKGETFIYQSSKDFSYYFPRTDSTVVAAHGVAVQDSFPVVEGKYRLTVLLRNSVGKEFSLLEKDVLIEGGEAPRIGGPILCYRVEQADASTLTAFKIFDRKAHVDAKNLFSPADAIVILYNIENLVEETWKTGEVRLAISGTQGASPIVKSSIFRLREFPFSQILPLSWSLPSSELPPDYYELKLILGDGEKILDEKKATFIVTPSEAVARPIILSKTFPRSGTTLLYLTLAAQAEKVGNPTLAEDLFHRATELSPTDPEVAAYYCGFLMRSKKFAQALEHIEKIKADPTLLFDYYLIKGKALGELGRCEEAIPLLLEGNKIYNSDTRLLNALGYCFYKTGEKKRALEALNASIRLDPSQEEIQKLIAEINKK